MYNCRIVTDAGKSIGFGWLYDSVFDLSPLSGADVALATSQGFGQIGETLENQSVGGISRTIKGVFTNRNGSALATAKTMLDVLPVFTTGKLYFNDDYYCDIIVKKTPVISKEKFGRINFSIMVWSANPFWYSSMESKYGIGVYVPAFHFPVTYDSHIFAIRNPDAYVDVYNPGSVKVPFKTVFTCNAPVENPGIVNVVTLEYLSFDLDLELGDKLTIYRENNRLKAELERDGETSDVFGDMDENSNLFWLVPNDNTIKVTADDGDDNLQCLISFNPAYMGVLDEN